MKKVYTAPSIERNSAGSNNKFAYKSVVSHQDNIEGIPVRVLTENYGSPVFVFSETVIRKRYRKLVNHHLQQAAPP